MEAKQRETASSHKSQRAAAAVFTLGLCLMVVVPSLASKPKDSYPLSTYPMFAKARGRPLVHQLVGVDKQGQRVAIPPALLGTSEVLQAKALIRHSVKSRSRRKKLCQEVASRARKSKEFSHLKYIDLVAARYDAIEYMVTSPKPVKQRRLYRCKVDSDVEARKGRAGDSKAGTTAGRPHLRDTNVKRGKP